MGNPDFQPGPSSTGLKRGRKKKTGKIVVLTGPPTSFLKTMIALVTSMIIQMKILLWLLPVVKMCRNLRFTAVRVVDVRWSFQRPLASNVTKQEVIEKGMLPLCLKLVITRLEDITL